MSEWKNYSLGRELRLTTGFPFLSRLFSNEGGIPLIRIRDLLTSQIETYYLGSALQTYIVRTGDVLVGMDGDFNIVKWQNSDALLNQRVLKVDVVDPSRICLDYIFHWLKPYIAKVNEKTAATTVKHLSTKDIQRAIPRLPDIDVQKKIALILSTLDTVIEKTEALIAKYQNLKAGLMHDLFTRGVLPNGQLRPPQTEAPELYKQTEIGWIPREWEVTTLGRLSSTVTSGSRDWANYYSVDGPVFVRIGNLTREHINFRFDSTTHVAPPNFGEGQRTRLLAGDILISITADLGIVGVVPDDLGEAYINQHIALVRPIPGAVNARFVGHFLSSESSQTRIRMLNDSGAKAGLNLPAIQGIPIAFPFQREQLVISDTLDRIDVGIGTERALLANLRQQKQGLMHDLLTGKVEVGVEAVHV